MLGVHSGASIAVPGQCEAVRLCTCAVSSSTQSLTCGRTSGAELCICLAGMQVDAPCKMFAEATWASSAALSSMRDLAHARLDDSCSAKRGKCRHVFAGGIARAREACLGQSYVANTAESPSVKAMVECLAMQFVVALSF